MLKEVCVPGALASTIRSAGLRQHIRRHLAVVRFLLLQGGIGMSFLSLRPGITSLTWTPGPDGVVIHLPPENEDEVRYNLDSDSNTKGYHRSLPMPT